MRNCERCQAEIPFEYRRGRPKKYCDDCRSEAYEEKHRERSKRQYERKKVAAAEPVLEVID